MDQVARVVATERSSSQMTSLMMGILHSTHPPFTKVAEEPLFGPLYQLGSVRMVQEPLRAPKAQNRYRASLTARSRVVCLCQSLGPVTTLAEIRTLRYCQPLPLARCLLESSGSLNNKTERAGGFILPGQARRLAKLGSCC